MGKTNKTPGLGDRMKDYENVNRFYLTRRMPLIIRIDGRAFHTFAEDLKSLTIEYLQNQCKILRLICVKILKVAN